MSHSFLLIRILVMEVGPKAQSDIKLDASGYDASTKQGDILIKNKHFSTLSAVGRMSFMLSWHPAVNM